MVSEADGQIQRHSLANVGQDGEIDDEIDSLLALSTPPKERKTCDHVNVGGYTVKYVTHAGIHSDMATQW